MKYTLGETLWIMRSNKAHPVEVCGRQYTHTRDGETESYQCHYPDGLVHWHWVADLYPTREALLSSIGVGA